MKFAFVRGFIPRTKATMEGGGSEQSERRKGETPPRVSPSEITYEYASYVGYSYDGVAYAKFG